VKTLPDNPSIVHLRRQAKELLAGLRDSAPGTALAEAQARLAGQYGFRRWTDLKAEVDRRRARGTTADDGLGRAVAACFGLGDVASPMESLGRDDMGTRWKLETDRGRFAVRTMDTWRLIVDAETDFALQRAAAGAGICLPAPVRSLSGSIMETAGGHMWRVSEWVRCGPPLAAPVSAQIMFEAGRILATIHRLALPVDRISPYHLFSRSEREWSELAASARAGRAAWAPILTDAIPLLVDLRTLGAEASPPPPVLCHNVMGPNRVRLGRAGRLIVFDWEHAGGQPPSWELSDALLHWAGGLGEPQNVVGARAMADGYRDVAGNLPQLSLGTFRGAVTGWLNYAYDQVNLALNGGDADDREFAARDVPDLLAHPPTSTKLQRLLDAATR
jgi:Ser/Thr protein kinase RdoA (MazF antagonist)